MCLSSAPRSSPLEGYLITSQSPPPRPSHVQLTNHTVGGDYEKLDKDKLEEEATKPALGVSRLLPRVTFPSLVAAHVSFSRRS